MASGVTIIPDHQFDNKKCENNRRVFDLRGEDAVEQKCKEVCMQIKECRYFSGVWNNWCIGCSAQLGANHDGAISFRTTEGK